jgi:hypothetical protein
VIGVVIGMVACLAATRGRQRLPSSATTQPAAEAPAAEAPAAEAPAAEVPAAEVPAAEVPAAEVPAAEVNATDQVERLEVEAGDVVAELERRYRGRKADDMPELADAAEKAKPSSRGRPRR